MRRHREPLYDALRAGAFGSSDERTFSCVHLKLPEDGNYVEFMLYDEPPTLERLGVLNRFGLEVPSVPAATEEVSRRTQGRSREFPRRVEYNIGNTGIALRTSSIRTARGPSSWSAGHSTDPSPHRPPSRPALKPLILPSPMKAWWVFPASP